MSKAFKGFPKPTSNYFTVPNIMLDEFSEITSLAEIKVILYLIRHTWGFHEYGKPKPITTDEFMNGRKRKDGSRIDKGTGLKSNKSVIEGLELAEEHGFIVSETDDTDRARIVKAYALKMYDEEPEEEPARCVESTHPRRVDATHRYVDATHQRVDSTQRTEKHTLGKTLTKNNGETHTRPASSKAPTSSIPKEPDVCVSSSFSNSSSQKEAPPQEKKFTELEETIFAEWERITGIPINRSAGKLKEQVSYIASLIEQGKKTLADLSTLIAKCEKHHYTKQQGGLNFAIFKHLLSTQPALLKPEPAAGSQEMPDEFMACLMENMITSQSEETA